MKKVMRKTFLIVCGILLCTMSAVTAKNIEDVNYNYNTQKVEISGSGFYGNTDGYVTVMVLKNETRENYIPSVENGTDPHVEKQAQLEIDANGSFSLEFELSAPQNKDVYNVYVKAAGVTKESGFTYIANIDSIYDTVMQVEQYTAARIHTYRSQLGLTNTVYDRFGDGTKTRTASQMLITQTVANQRDAIMAEVAANGNNKKLGVELIKQAVRQAAYVQALNDTNENNNLIAEVVVDGQFNAPEILGLTDLGGTAYELFCNNTSDTGVEKVIKSLIGKDYTVKKDGVAVSTDIDGFLSDFAYYATIAAIKNYCIDGEAQSGSGHVKTILKANATIIGLDLAENYNKVSSTSTIDNKLVSGNAWERKDVQDVLDTPVETSKKDPTDTSGNNSSKPSTGIVGGYSAPYGVVDDTQATPVGTFTDVTDDILWAKPAIEGLAEKGVISGRGDGTFAPLDNVTRAEFISLIVRALGLTSEGATCEFLDVKEGDWSYEFVAIGSTLGITSGYGNGYFGATDFITRQDAAAMLYNAISKTGKTLVEQNNGIDFADKGEISDYAATGIDLLVKAGILSGSDGNFMPLKTATRAEAAVMLSNIMTALGLEG